MNRRWMILAGLLLALPAAGGEPPPLPAIVAGNQLIVPIEAEGFTGTAVLTFEDPDGLDNTALEVTAEAVDPDDPLLLLRLPDDVFIPSDFPVLLRIRRAGGSNFGFSGQWSLELETDDLQFASNTPLRLFRARTGVAPFEDLSLSLGQGSFRVRGASGSFSEFLIASDLRPQRLVIRGKFQRFLALLIANANDIDPTVAETLEGLAMAAQASFENGDIPAALLGLNQLLGEILANAGSGINNIWYGLGSESVVGILRGAARTLRLSITQRLQPQPEETGGTSTRLDVGDVSVIAKVAFEDAFAVDLDGLSVTGDLIDPKDPALLARLPPGVIIPSEFPVLIHVDPGSNAAQSFRGTWSLELRTEDLDLLGSSPLRLFKAPDGGAFEDISSTYGLGSFRVRGASGSFSEFLIASDLRPIDDTLEAKLDDLDACLDGLGGIVPVPLLAILQGLASDIRNALEQGLLPAAIVKLDEFLDTVADNAGDGIPATWHVSDGRLNVAGLLLQKGRSLRFSLVLRRIPAEDPADTNRDGVVDILDVFHVIDLVFEGNPVPLLP